MKLSSSQNQKGLSDLNVGLWSPPCLPHLTYPVSPSLSLHSSMMDDRTSLQQLHTDNIPTWQLQGNEDMSRSTLPY